VRRKVFRFRGRPIVPGSAVVGPVIITGDGGQRQTLNAIAVQVLPDRAASSNDPPVILRELLATDRDPLFITAEASSSRAYVGEQVVLTWWLFNAATVQQWQIGSIPKLNDFWVEELDVRSAPPSQALVAGMAMQKMPIRRVALYPLRSGKLDVGSMEVEAAVMRRTRYGPFGLFEGSVTEVSYVSAPLTIDIVPVPPGPPVAAVGDLSLRCSSARQKDGGPVVFDAMLRGRGNVRAASRPELRGKTAGDVQVIDGGVTIDKSRDAPVLTRRWRYMIFPARDGRLAIPSLEATIFAPSLGQRETLACAATSLMVTAAQPESVAAESAPSRRSVASAFRRNAPWLGAGALLIVLAALVVRRWRNGRRLERDVRALVAERSPVQIREAVHERLGIDAAALLRESSERGDAYRSLRSLLDALEHDRIHMDNAEREIRRRVRDLLVA